MFNNKCYCAAYAHSRKGNLVLNDQKVLDEEGHSEGLKEGVVAGLKQRRLKAVDLNLLAQDKSSWKFHVNLRVP